MKTDENNSDDWYRSASVRLGSVDRLYPLEGTSESVIELLQEAVERFLKGLSHLEGVAVDKNPRFGSTHR
jgi:hypothetical protein